MTSRSRSPNACLLFLTAMLLTTQASCLAGTAKLRVGPTVNVEGTAAIQADLAFGFGYATSTESGVTASLGVGTRSSNDLKLTDTIEYNRLSEDYGWRTGSRLDVGVVGDDKTNGPPNPRSWEGWLPRQCRYIAVERGFRRTRWLPHLRNRKGCHRDQGGVWGSCDAGVARLQPRTLTFWICSDALIVDESARVL